jgi:hypothetical protein
LVLLSFFHKMKISDCVLQNQFFFKILLLPLNCDFLYWFQDAVLYSSCDVLCIIVVYNVLIFAVNIIMEICISKWFWRWCCITVIYFFGLYPSSLCFSTTTFQGMALPSSSGEPTLVGPFDPSKRCGWET